MAPALLRIATLALRASSLTCPVTPTCPQDNQCTYLSNGVSLQVSCGTDFYGGDLQLAQTSTLAGCMNICAATSKCVAASYLGQNCYMKSTLNSAQANGNVIGVSVVSRETASSPNPGDSRLCPKSYTCPEQDGCIYQGDDGRNFALKCDADFYGGDFTNLYAESLQICNKACADDARCVAASFVGGKGDGRCYLKDRNNGAGANDRVDGFALDTGVPASSTTSSDSLTTVVATTSDIVSSTPPAISSSLTVVTSSTSSSLALSSSSDSSSSTLTPTPTPTPSTSSTVSSSMIESSLIPSSSTPSASTDSSSTTTTPTPTPSTSSTISSSMVVNSSLAISSSSTVAIPTTSSSMTPTPSISSTASLTPTPKPTGAQIIINPSFEDGIGNSVSPWVQVAARSSPSIAGRVDGEARTGGFSYQAAPLSSMRWTHWIEQPITAIPGESYDVSVWAKTNAEMGSCTIIPYVNNARPQGPVLNTNTAYMQGGARFPPSFFTKASNTFSISIRCETGKPSGKIWIDDITMTQVIS